MKRTDWIILGVLLLAGLALRLYKIESPLADWHSWRQADTAAVSRNYARNGIDMLHPTYDDYSNVQSGQYNPQGYRFVEFPVYNAVTTVIAKISQAIPIEVYGRIVTIVMSLLLIIATYILVNAYHGRTAATVAALFLATFPFPVYYSRVVLPDMTAVSVAMLSILLLHFWVGMKGRSQYILYFGSWFLFALSLLIKPTTIFFAFPLLYLHFKRFGTDVMKRILVYVFFASSVIPFMLWRVWIAQYPEGIPVSGWLFTTINGAEGKSSIFLRPSFFRWIFQERILQLITGGFMGVFAILGVIYKSKKGAFALTMGVAAIVYLFVFEGGNVQHDYYQIMILPALAALIGAGVAGVIGSSSRDTLPQWAKWPILIVCICLSWYFSFYQIQKNYDVNGGIIQAARILRTLTPADSLLATDTTGDTTLLYLADRKGFPALADDPDKMMERGISYLVTFNSDYARQLAETYPLIFENDSLFVLKLK